MWRVPIFLLVTSALSPGLLTGCHQSSNGGRASSPPGGSSGGSPGSAGATGQVDAAPGPGGRPGDDANPGPGPTPDSDAAPSPADADAPTAGDDSGAGGAPSLDAPVISATGAAAMLVAGLSPQRFRDNIKTVAGFGDRLQGSTRFDAASAWLDQTLSGLGYTVEHHSYTFQGGPRINTFVTKVGSTSPDRMYIVGAHLDGRGNGGGADDDGSGVSLVLEVARAFAPATVQTDVSIRFAFWCNEETGMDGSRAYVTDRAARQGVEDPPGSHKFPEPRWLGMIQHDMMLYDHGLPPGPTQRPGADINIDY
ncbi:MAG TPA: M20/M25/M40 family metallo-hydrolase, partial [Polyangia bacterium]|nr:M20/M25/M40 family metallo-hydrolase [Polyangia bacterium]